MEEAFWHSPKVMTVSFHHLSPGFFPGQRSNSDPIHRSPLTPPTGTGAVSDVGGGRGRFFTVNVPLLEGAGDNQYHSLFNGVMGVVWERYQPQCLLMQCGADLLAGDPLGEFNLTPRGATGCVADLLQWKLPTVVMGGGQY